MNISGERLCYVPAVQVICIALCTLDCKEQGWQCCCCVGKGCSTHEGLPILIKTVKARKCRLFVGSLMLVLVTSNWKYVVWILRINRLLLLDRTAENAEAV